MDKSFPLILSVWIRADPRMIFGSIPGQVKSVFTGDVILGKIRVKHPPFALHLPAWLKEFALRVDQPFPAVEERMRFVIELSRLNIRHRTGGPFGAAVFRTDNGALLAPGVNLVIAGRCSVLHAEVVAIADAQCKAGTYDLSSAGLPPYELVTSTEPCAMCLGAVPWSGVRRLVCGARGEDAEDIGFDEGEKPPAWTEALEQRGISVLRDICREQAVAVLRAYRDGGGIIYNPRRDKAPRGAAETTESPREE